MSYSWKDYYYNCYKKMSWKSILHSIKQRCNNSNNKAYKWYGGRGIKCRITEEEIKKLMIRDNYWSLKRPSIDRINTNGDYTYDNCRFIEMSLNIGKRNKEKSVKKIIQFDKKGMLIAEFESVIKASKKTNIRYSSISKNASGKQKTAGGYIWKYK